jgi:hypothetical protein
VPLQAGNGRDICKDIADETLDRIVYAEQAAQERPEFADIMRGMQARDITTLAGLLDIYATGGPAMSVMVTTYTDDAAPSRERLPEGPGGVRRLRQEGPARSSAGRRSVAGSTTRTPLALAVLVAAYHRVTVFLRQGKARGEHRCAACVKASELT